MYKSRLRQWKLYKNNVAKREEHSQPGDVAITILSSSGKQLVLVDRTTSDDTEGPIETSHDQVWTPEYRGPSSCGSLLSELRSPGHQVDSGHRSHASGDLQRDQSISSGTNEDNTTISRSTLGLLSESFGRSMSSISSTDQAFPRSSMQRGSWSQWEHAEATIRPALFARDTQKLLTLSTLTHSHRQVEPLDPVTSTMSGAFSQGFASVDNGEPTLFQMDTLNDMTAAELLAIDESRWSIGAATQHDIAQLQDLADLYSSLGCCQCAFLVSQRLIILHESHSETDFTSLSLSPDIIRMVINATEDSEVKQVRAFVERAVGRRHEFLFPTMPHMYLLQSHLGVLINKERNVGRPERHSELAVQGYKKLTTAAKLDFRFLAVLANQIHVNSRSEKGQNIVPTSQRPELVLSLPEVQALVTRLFHLLKWCLEVLGNENFRKMYQHFPEELWSEDVAVNTLECMEHRLVFCYLYQHWKAEVLMSHGGLKFSTCRQQLSSFLQDQSLHPNDTMMALARMIVQFKSGELRKRETLAKRVHSRLRVLTDQAPVQTSNDQNLSEKGKVLLYDFIDAHMNCLHKHHHRFPKGSYGNLLQSALLDFVDENLTLSLSSTIFADSRVRGSPWFADPDANVAHVTLSPSPTSTMSDIESMIRMKEKARTRASTSSPQALMHDETRMASQESLSGSGTTTASAPISPLDIEILNDRFDTLRFPQDMDEDDGENEMINEYIDESIDDNALPWFL